MIVTARYCETFEALAGKLTKMSFHRHLVRPPCNLQPTIPECETSTTIVPIEHFEELHQRYHANHHPVSSFFSLVAMYCDISS